MTSEVCIMNRNAIVLAADSATTVSQWNDEGQRETRYFKGANKIFQISEREPVGLMIYDSADILNVPWELVIKAFRSELGDKSFNDLSGYASEFFDFISNNTRIFPDDVRKEAFINAARTAALTILFDIPGEDKATGEERVAAYEKSKAEMIASIEGNAYAEGLNDQMVVDAQGAHAEELRIDLLDWLATLRLENIADPVELANIGIKAVFKDPASHLSTTGLVFAGFGDHDVFPESLSYTSCGLLLTRHVVTSVEHDVVSHQVPASLKAFAQTSMSDTFTLGFSQDVYRSLVGGLMKELDGLAEKICGAVGAVPAQVPRLEEMVRDARLSVTKGLLDKARKDHAFPLRRVIGVLPIDEMAELAETLINLQSLKEKVTKPSETVGGPIDVAVITKSEGLIWIKRKHYFDPALNPRFMKRVGI